MGGFESGVFEDGFFEGEEAEHFVEEFDHFGDSAFVPCPDLGADVVDLSGVGEGFADGFCEAEVEARVVDEEEGVWFECFDFCEHLGEAFLEP